MAPFKCTMSVIQLVGHVASFLVPPYTDTHTHTQTHTVRAIHVHVKSAH